jgi:hypothetical protein
MKITALALFVLAAIAIEAQAPPSFREGVLAFEKKDWAIAERLMRETIAGNPNEVNGTVSIAGSWFETYVPHYFLARALAKQGRCSEALAEFAESERQGVTPAIPDFAAHLKTRDGCGSQSKKETKPKKVDVVVVPFEPEPVPKTTTHAPIELPQPKATTHAPIEPPPISPSPSNDTGTRLVAGIAAYLRGDYEQTTTLLSASKFTDRAAAAEAALFRAAARDALYRIGGSKSDALRRDVERDLKTYRQLNPNGHPDTRVFPPRFVAMVRSSS